MDGKDKANDRPRSGRNGQPVPESKGRPKGIPNKVTTEFKEGLNKLFEYATPRMVEWLEQIDDPERRFDILSKFANYLYPKLSSTDMNHGGQEDRPVVIRIESAITGAPNSRSSTDGKKGDM